MQTSTSDSGILHQPIPLIDTRQQASIPAVDVDHLEQTARDHSGSFERHSAVPLPLRIVNPNQPASDSAPSFTNSTTTNNSTFAKQTTRTLSNASTATTRQARTAFGDFDGVHYTSLNNNLVEEEEEEEDEQEEYEPNDNDANLDTSRSIETHSIDRRGLSPSSDVNQEQTGLLQDDDDRQEHTESPDVPFENVDAISKLVGEISSDQRWGGVPAPKEDMVYYPAPVPMTLNLPKRLSRVPLQQAQRRSRMDVNYTGNARSSRQPNLGQERPSRSTQYGHLPPQLRASVFFEHAPVEQRLTLQNGSAVLALESLLEESTRVAVPRQASGQRDSTMTRQSRDNLQGKKQQSQHRMTRSRSSELLSPRIQVDTAESHDGEQGHRTASYSSSEGERLVNEHHLHDEEVHGERSHLDEDHHEDEDDPERDILENIPLEPEPQYPRTFQHEAAPNTLMAELQLRKHQLKSRNRNAADTFPNGARSTLLQLDAVAQIENQRRRNKKTRLAWEERESRMQGLNRSTDNLGRHDLPDQENEDDDEDDDVPLGVLYAKPEEREDQGRPSGMPKPLGLLQQRTMEDSEPLSNRRNRLKDLPLPSPIRPVAPEIEPEDDSDHADETLAQRHRRLRSQNALDEAIKDTATHHRSVSTDFANEMMSQLGGSTPVQEADVVPEEETLGQRRKRLQGIGSPVVGVHGPIERSSSSQLKTLGAMLSDHPIESTRRPVYMPTAMSSGGLLGLEDQRQQQRRYDMAQQYQGRGGVHAVPYQDAFAHQQYSQPSMRGMLGNQSANFRSASYAYDPNSHYVNAGPYPQQMQQYGGYGDHYIHRTPSRPTLQSSMSMSQLSSIDQWRQGVR